MHVGAGLQFLAAPSSERRGDGRCPHHDGERVSRVRDDREQDVGVVLDLEVEAPVAIDAGLPDVARLVVLLGAERMVTEVAEQESKLLLEVLADSSRCCSDILIEPVGSSCVHVRA